jgi:hypothetical protein
MEKKFSQIITYDVSEAVLVELESKKELKINGVEDKQGYLAVETARKEAKALKISVENRRKEIKADALEFGRMVDTEAKKYSERLIDVEKTLEAEQTRIDNEKARIKFLKEQTAKLPERKLRLAEFGVEIADDVLLGATDLIFQEKIQSLIAERQTKIQAQQEAERQKLADEANRIKKEQEEAQSKIQAQQDKIDNDKKEIEQQKKEAEIKEQARLAGIEEQKRKEAFEKLEKEKAEKEQQKADEKNKKLQEWLTANSFNKEMDILKNNGTEYILFKEVARFNSI